MNGLVKTLIKPDWDDNPKRSKILHAANLLHIGEFQLIQLAYKVWYGKDLPEEKINKIFSEYMISGIIPIWVTYYAKDLIKIETKEHHAIKALSYSEILVFTKGPRGGKEYESDTYRLKKNLID